MLRPTQDETEEEEDELLASVAGREGLPEALTEGLPDALTRRGGASDASAETRGAAWAADGVAAAALAAVEAEEEDEPPDEGPDTRALPLQAKPRGGAAAGAVSRQGLPKVQPATTAAGTAAATGGVDFADSAGKCSEPLTKLRPQRPLQTGLHNGPHLRFCQCHGISADMCTVRSCSVCTLSPLGSYTKAHRPLLLQAWQKKRPRMQTWVTMSSLMRWMLANSLQASPARCEALSCVLVLPLVDCSGWSGLATNRQLCSRGHPSGANHRHHSLLSTRVRIRYLIEGA